MIAMPLCALAGMQMKAPAYESFACDDCWAEYKTRIEEKKNAKIKEV
jgi:hypothetical protein